MALLDSPDMAQVESRLEHLSAVALKAAAGHGLAVASPLDPKCKGPTTAIRVRDSAAMDKKMAEAGFIASARGPCIRVAPHFYNSEQEVADAMAALARLQ